METLILVIEPYFAKTNESILRDIRKDNCTVVSISTRPNFKKKLANQPNNPDINFAHNQHCLIQTLTTIMTMVPEHSIQTPTNKQDAQLCTIHTSTNLYMHMALHLHIEGLMED